MDFKPQFFPLLTSILLLVSTGCHKICVRNHYDFAINSSIFYPELDSMAIGDTLFFKSETSNHLINLADGKIIDYSKSPNVGSIIGITELISINETNDAVKNFTFISIKGKIYTDNNLSPGKVKQVIFAEENNKYILFFAIIPQKKGIYFLATADMPDVVKDCNRAAISMKITNVNPHLNYLKDIYYGGGNISSLDSAHGYCFKVY